MRLMELQRNKTVSETEPESVSKEVMQYVKMKIWAVQLWIMV